MIRLFLQNLLFHVNMQLEVTQSKQLTIDATMIFGSIPSVIQIYGIVCQPEPDTVETALSLNIF